MNFTLSKNPAHDGACSLYCYSSCVLTSGRFFSVAFLSAYNRARNVAPMEEMTRSEVNPKRTRCNRDMTDMDMCNKSE